MDDHNLKENRCRICLDEPADLDWNNFMQGESQLTYKDWYYSLTRLECLNEDRFPTTLCRKCSDCLENINIFITKAKETHNFLFNKSCLESEDDVIKVEPEILEVMLEKTEPQHEAQHFEVFEDCEDEFVMEIEPSNISDSPIPLAEKTGKQKCHIKVEKSAPKQLRDSATPLKQKKRKKRKQTEHPSCCTICSKVLSSKYNAIRHEKTHRNRERNSECSECGLRFYDERTLSNHIKIHSENREKKYKCEFCDKTFFYAGALNVHRRIHLGQMISCKLCTKKYARQFDLDKHMATHSVTRINGSFITKKKFYVVCEFCDEKVRSVRYKSHIAKHKNVPLFKCSLCDKEFFSRDGCNSHLKLFHKKGNGERANLILSLKTNRRCSNLYMQQKSSQVFIEE